MAFLETHQDYVETSSAEEKNHLLNPAQRAFFDEHGYLAIDRVTTDEVVAVIRAELQRPFTTKAGFDEGAPFDFAGADNDDTSAEFAPKAPQMLGPERFAPKLR